MVRLARKPSKQEIVTSRTFGAEEPLGDASALRPVRKSQRARVAFLLFSSRRFRLRD
jgi:hypothetical protein